MNSAATRWGAGAFRLKEWRRGEVIILERNPHYWEEGLPLVDQVEWHVVSEDNTRIPQGPGGRAGCGPVRSLQPHRRSSRPIPTSR